MIPSLQTVTRVLVRLIPPCLLLVYSSSPPRLLLVSGWEGLSLSNVTREVSGSTSSETNLIFSLVLILMELKWSLLGKMPTLNAFSLADTGTVNISQQNNMWDVVIWRKIHESKGKRNKHMFHWLLVSHAETQWCTRRRPSAASHWALHYHHFTTKGGTRCQDLLLTSFTYVGRAVLVLLAIHHEIIMFPFWQLKGTESFVGDGGDHIKSKWRNQMKT